METKAKNEPYDFSKTYTEIANEIKIFQHRS